jgi:hypothetical protein
MTGRGCGGWVSEKATVSLAHCAESAAAHIRLVFEGQRAGSDCLLERPERRRTLAVPPSRTHARSRARSGKFGAGFTIDHRRSTAPAAPHPCMHCGEAQARFTVSHRIRIARLHNLVGGRVSLTLGLKLNQHLWDRTWCNILFQ